MATPLWIDLNAKDLIVLSGIWIAFLILAIQGRQSYLFQEARLDDRQKGECIPEMVLFRRIRLWSSVSLVGTTFAILSLLKVSAPIINVFLNLSSFFISLAFLLLLIAFLRYLITTYLIDLIATTFQVESITLIKKGDKKRGQEESAD
jgi:hypothetical protein